MGEKVGKTVKAQMTTRALTKLEKRSMKNYNRTKKYEENYLQIGTEVSISTMDIVFICDVFAFKTLITLLLSHLLAS